MKIASGIPPSSETHKKKPHIMKEACAHIRRSDGGGARINVSHRNIFSFRSFSRAVCSFPVPSLARVSPSRRRR